MICYYYTEPTLWVFASDLPKLLYYSHISVFVVAVLVALFILIKGRGRLLNNLLSLFALSFSCWLFINLIAWGSNNSSLTMSVWPLFGMIQSFIASLAVYLMYVFLYKKDLPFIFKGILSLLILPVILLAPTDLTVSGFNIAWCDAFEYENAFMLNYYTALGIGAMVAILLMSIHAYTKKNAKKAQILLMTSGIEIFLILFFLLVYIGSIMAAIGLVDDSAIEFYGVFSMGFFIVIIGVLSVKYKAFNFNAHGASVLVAALIALIASQYTYANSTTTTIILTTVTLTLSAIAGFFLVRSVNKEVKQREQLEKLTLDLERANTRLKELDKLKSEFVSIASHQLRSPLTSIRGYASMLAEGSFGQLPEKAVEPVSRIAESSRLMALAVEDYLNVSRIESGNMKYNMSHFVLREEVEKITDDIRPSALKKGLVLLFRNKLNSKGLVNADIGKTVQIIHNLINNSLKYTPKGSITVLLRDDVSSKKIFVDIIDTGIGMSQQTLERVFQKFERADNANSVNVSGTGLGLFVALKMAEAMGGTISAHSDGDDKGSCFTLELPLID